MASGAIFGLVSKIGAMHFAEKIGTQFKTLGYLISDTATGMGSFIGLLSKVGGVSAIAVPALMGVVAAVLGLAAAYKAIKDSQDYDLQLFKLQEVEEEYTNIQERIKELESYNGDLTQSEERELEVLKRQTAELEKQIEKRKGRADKALTTERNAAITGYESRQDDPYTDPYFASYNKLERQFENLVSQAKEGKQNTRAYRKEVDDFANAYGELADKLATAAENGRELDETDLQIIENVSMARAELEYLNEATEGNFKFTTDLGYSYNTLEENLTGATAALEKFNTAMSTDYSAQFGGYQDAYKSLNKSIQSGTANVQQIRAGVELFLPEGTLESLNYDMDAAAKLLAESFSGNFGKILQSEDPIGALTQTILQNNGVLKTDSGETAAYIDSNNKLHVQSYELLAQAFGTSTDAAKALFGVLQSGSGHILHTGEEVSRLGADLEKAFGEDYLSRNAEDLVSKISELTGATDPLELKSWVDALYEATGETMTVDVEADVGAAITSIGEVAKSTEDLKDKTITITEYVEDRELKAALGPYNALQDKVVTVTIRTVNVGGGGGYSPTVTPETYSYSENSGGYPVSWSNASGTKSAKSGLSLVNDGSSVNGSQAELIVQNGRAFIANGGQTGFVNLEAGATVYNAKDTQEILRRSGLSERDLGVGVRSFATGSTGLDVSRYIGGSSSGGGYYAGGDNTYKPAPSEEETLADLLRYLDFNEQDIQDNIEWASQWAEANSKIIFDEYYKKMQHYRKMDIIDEETYYKLLYTMNEMWLSKRESLVDDYWRYQEEIYEWEKRDLKDIVDLEEKLNDLAKAKTQKVLVYKDGMFQYIQNTEAVARAQRAVQGYANGTTSAAGGMQLVGEHGAELRLLNQGDGIIPANLTRNLMRIGSMGINAMGGYGDSYILTIGTLKLEKVNDVDGLFNGLKNYAVQSAAMRK